MEATEQLYLAQRVPESIFPQGCHVFAADALAVNELKAALEADFARVELVNDAELNSGAPRPLALPALRAFLEVRRAGLMAHWDEQRIRRNTLAHAQERLAALRQLGAPEVVLAHAQATIEDVSSATWIPGLELELLVPDACGAASLVDAQEPRYVEADVSSLVLLAALSCVRPGAQSLRLEAEMAWLPLYEASDAVSQAGGVSVRPAVYERVQRLEFADGGALLQVVL